MDSGTPGQTGKTPQPDHSTETLIECSEGSSLLPWQSSKPRQTVTAVKDVSFAINRGETVGFAGPSGSGKSTLLHLVAGLVTPTDGRVELAGTDLGSLSSRERATIRHRHIGLVFQRFHLLPSLSARANVALPLVQSGTPRSERRERAKMLLERVGLGQRVTHQPNQLSGGEQQRVAICRALATQPDIILADEPTGELDRDTGEKVMDLLTDLSAERAVLLASHDEAVLERADYVYRLTDGQITDTGQ
jgi:putative ABC transport system ATP-binding protein